VRTSASISGRQIDYDEVDIEEAARLQAEGAVVIDVRNHDERAERYVAGSIHIPLPELPNRLDEVPAGRVLTVCKLGARSAMAAEILEKFGGRDDVSSIAGGTDGWAAAGKPTARD
jgi:rhodanese-related sulfurtransferase